MNIKLEIAIQNCFSRSQVSHVSGTIIDRNEWDALNVSMNGIIPTWLIDLFTKYPLSHSTISIQDNEDDEMEYDLEFVSPGWMKSESLEAYPGCSIIDLGYICIAADPSGSGNPYFINVNEGDDPTVFKIYHDVSDVAEEIIAEGRETIANSLSELFTKGELVE